jgi:hypothetical protein
MLKLDTMANEMNFDECEFDFAFFGFEGVICGNVKLGVTCVW